MTQSELNRAVARATGENLRVISRLGFGLADPVFVEHDPEPCDVEARCLDWDAVDSERCLAVT
jgi:hypothetical protein